VLEGFFRCVFAARQRIPHGSVKKCPQQADRCLNA
jgi:hypothetical protein